MPGFSISFARGCNDTYTHIYSYTRHIINGLIRGEPKPQKWVPPVLISQSRPTNIYQETLMQESVSMKGGGPGSFDSGHLLLPI